MTTKAREVLQSMFKAFLATPALLPDDHQATVGRMESQAGESGRARAVADYIAGMTDRYAILEHSRLFDPAERS
jgi:dGTPase